MKKALKNVLEVMEWLRSADVYEKYISAEGRAFIDGVTSCGYTPELIDIGEYNILKEKYDKIELENHNLMIKLKKLNKKNKWFK